MLDGQRQRVDSPVYIMTAYIGLYVYIAKIGRKKMSFLSSSFNFLGTLLRQVRFPGAARDFSPRVTWFWKACRGV